MNAADLAVLTAAIKDGMSAATINITAPESNPRNPVAAPDEYDGNLDTYETFRRNAEIHARGFKEDYHKILAIVSKLTKDSANIWAQVWMQENQPRVDNRTMTWAEFLADLDKKFLDPKHGENARKALFKSTQGSQAADVFFLKFDELRVKAGLTVAQHHDILLVEHLRTVMNQQTVLATMGAFEAERDAKLVALRALRDVLEAAGLPTGKIETQIDAAEKPISYARFREIATVQDHIVQQHHHSQPTRVIHEYRSRPQPAPVVPAAPPVIPVATPAPPVAIAPAVAPTPPPRDPDAMEVDRVAARRLGLCFKCGQKGHIGRNCPNFRNAIRGLTLADAEEIAELVDEGCFDLHTTDEDFPAPQ